MKFIISENILIGFGRKKMKNKLFRFCTTAMRPFGECVAQYTTSSTPLA